jgi:hypothetical protein
MEGHGPGCCGPPAEADEEDEWDDYEYELGAVAIPLDEMTEGLGFAAVAHRKYPELPSIVRMYCRTYLLNGP